MCIWYYSLCCSVCFDSFIIKYCISHLRISEIRTKSKKIKHSSLPQCVFCRQVPTTSHNIVFILQSSACSSPLIIYLCDENVYWTVTDSIKSVEFFPSLSVLYFLILNAILNKYFLFDFYTSNLSQHNYRRMTFFFFTLEIIRRIRRWEK